MTGQDRVVRKRILLVDDQPEVRETLKVLLEIDEHTVTEAADGRQALGLYQPGLYDLVITDYAMPHMRGDELAARVKAMAPSQPVLMVTGSAENSSGVGIGVDAILYKPFRFDALRQTVAQLLSAIPA
ncbi:MAG TPA: response regulator [Candidatus Binatia bacterium]|jgi:CheY-like chemotaxis protein|nr:response regulator [Candidatus Binatia bacterium]